MGIPQLLSRRVALRAALCLALLLVAVTLLLTLLQLGATVQAAATDAASPTPLTATQENVVVTFHSGGFAQAVAYDSASTFAYAGFGTELAQFDVSDPAAPQRVAYLLLPAFIVNIAADNGIVYAATAGNGVHIIDFNQSPPVVLSSLTGAATTRDVSLTQDLLLVAAGTDGLRLLDVANPAQPQLLSVATPAPFVRGVTQFGQQALALADDGSVTLYDVSNPISPTVVATDTLTGGAWDAVVVGNQAYVSYSDCSGNCRAQLAVYDISVSLTRIATRDVAPGVARGVAAGGGYAYLMHTGTSAEYFPAGMTVLDVSIPATPVVQGDFETPGAFGGYSIELVGTRAYVAYGGAGFHVVSLSDPTAPSSLGSYAPNGLPVATALADNLIYVVGGDGASLGQIDVLSADGQLQAVQRFPQFDLIRKLELEDTLGYALADDGPEDALLILDLSNPLEPTVLRRFTLPNAFNVAALPGVAYVSDGSRTRIFSTTVPVSATELASFPVAGELAISGTLGVLSAGNAGVRVLSLVTPTQPVEISGLDPVWPAERIALGGDIAYVSSGSNINLIDLSQPLTPTLQQSVVLSSAIEHLTYADGVLSAVTAADGIVVMVPSPMGGLVQTGRYQDGWQAAGLSSDGGTLFAPAPIDGLFGLTTFFDASGRIELPNGSGVNGIEVRLNGGLPTTTTSDGQYSWSGLPVGSWSAQPQLAFYVVSPTQVLFDTPRLTPLPPFVLLPAPVSTSVTPAGGILSYVDIQGVPVTVTIPAGAVSNTVTVILTPTVTAPPDGWASAHQAFELAVLENGLHQADFVFGQPLSVTVGYSAADVDGLDLSGIALWWREAGAWQPATTSCTPPSSAQHDVAQQQVVVGVCETGRFALVAPLRQIYLPVGVVVP